MKTNSFFLGYCIALLLLSFWNPITANTNNNVCTIELPCDDESVISDPIITSGSEEDGICIYYFYGLNCPKCAIIKPLLEELSEKYPEVAIKPFEIYFDNENQKLFNDFITRYNIKYTGIPAVFIGERAFIGETAIKENLENSIIYFIQNKPICPETYNKKEATPHDISPPYNVELTLPAVVSAALIDSINPCAFSVLIFLLVYLMSLGAKRRILKVGLTYIFVVFLVYFFSGLGLFVVVQTLNMTRIVYIVAAVIAILAGLVNVKDFFWYGKGFSLEIPKSKRPLLKKYVSQATIPAAIILGILVSMFELPCTGGIYLAILGLLSSKMTMMEGIPYLLLYNIIFVLPLVFILLLVYKGIPPEKVEKWRLKEKKHMKLAMGLAMIALGIIMLLGWI